MASNDSSLLYDLFKLFLIVPVILFLLNIARELTWYLVLALLWIFMIVLPILGILVLITAIQARKSSKVTTTILKITLSAILIFAGPLNHTLVRSPFNVFNPYGRYVTKTISPGNVKTYFRPYKHSAFDTKVIETLDLEEKAIKIYAWTQRLTVEQLKNGERNPRETITNIRNQLLPSEQGSMP